MGSWQWTYAYFQTFLFLLHSHWKGHLYGHIIKSQISQWLPCMPHQSISLAKKDGNCVASCESCKNSSALDLLGPRVTAISCVGIHVRWSLTPNTTHSYVKHNCLKWAMHRTLHQSQQSIWGASYGLFWLHLKHVLSFLYWFLHRNRVPDDICPMLEGTIHFHHRLNKAFCQVVLLSMLFPLTRNGKVLSYFQNISRNHTSPLVNYQMKSLSYVYSSIYFLLSMLSVYLWYTHPILCLPCWYLLVVCMHIW